MLLHYVKYLQSRNTKKTTDLTLPCVGGILKRGGGLFVNRILTLKTIKIFIINIC